jgi:hypothetical protein
MEKKIDMPRTIPNIPWNISGNFCSSVDNAEVISKQSSKLIFVLFVFFWGEGGRVSVYWGEVTLVVWVKLGSTKGRKNSFCCSSIIWHTHTHMYIHMYMYKSANTVIYLSIYVRLYCNLSIYVYTYINLYSKFFFYIYIYIYICHLIL